MQIRLVFDKHEELPLQAQAIIGLLPVDAEMDEQKVVIAELEKMGYTVETDMDGEIHEISKLFVEVRPNG